MTMLPCLRANEKEEPAAPLPQRVASQIEALRQERIRNYADEFQSELPRTHTGLEQSVDNLLDTLHNLHRLEQLAQQVARGGQITVEADRNLIASHEETYLALLERYAAQYCQTGAVVSSLLPSTPRPIE
jgi:hypothetical protein